jgi:uncharacterized membrane protein
MAGTKTRNLAFIFVATLLGALGQLLFKLAFLQANLVIYGYFGLYLGLGLASYLVSSVFYFYVLSRVHLSWAYTIGGIGYALAVVLAAVVLNESVPLLRWIGVAVVTVGVFLVGLS